MIDEEEYRIIKDLSAAKKAYRTHYDSLRGAKGVWTRVGLHRHPPTATCLQPTCACLPSSTQLPRCVCFCWVSLYCLCRAVCLLSPRPHQPPPPSLCCPSDGVAQASEAVERKRSEILEAFETWFEANAPPEAKGGTCTPYSGHQQLLYSSRC